MSWKNRFRYFKRIKARLVISYLFVALVTFIALFAFFYIQLKENIYDMSKSYLQSELDYITALLETSDYDSVERMTEFLSEYTASRRNMYFLSFALFDNEGYLLAATSGYSEDQSSVDSLKDSLSADTRVNDNNRGKIFVVTKKMKIPEERELYFLQLASGIHNRATALSVLFKSFMMTLPFILVIVLLLSLSLSEKIVSHIKKLNDAARSLASSNGSSELPVSGNSDELDQLASTFNEVYNKLQESNRQTIRFTSDASHELRLPIAAIKGEAEIILEHEREPEEYRRILQSMIEEMDKLNSLLSRLLMLARSDSGEDLLKKEKVSVDELVSQIVAFYEPLASSKDIKMSTQEKETGIYIYADKMKLNQLMSNLIENAIKYTSADGIISVSVSEQEGNCHISVSDTGIGINDKEIQNIFKRFYRVDKTRSRNEGSAGLGLSIADMIVKEHNGKIKVESQPGNGSVFTVVLPVDKHI